MTRHLRDRFKRVIGPQEAEHLARRALLDLKDQSDRLRFSKKTDCSYFVDLAPWGDGSTYVVVWTRRTAGAEAQLSSADTGIVYWRARHMVSRADGGLPISPIGVVLNSIEATMLQNDSDVDASLADDLARRLVGTLPITKPLYSSRHSKISTPSTNILNHDSTPSWVKRVVRIDKD